MASERRGRPWLGLISGFLLGVALAVDLLVFGVVPLHSVVLTILPVAGLLVGLGIGLTAPFGGGRGRSGGNAAAATLGLLLVAAGPILAVEDDEPSQPPSLTPGEPCHGSADIEGYDTIDPERSAGIYLVPRAGTADWEGRVDREEGDREVSGNIRLLLPPPLADVTLGEWGPDGEEVRKDGTYLWTDREGVGPEGANVLDGLRWVPSNVRFHVRGEHHDDVGDCEGYVELQLDGGFGDSPVGAGGLALTGLSLVGLGLAGRIRKP